MAVKVRMFPNQTSALAVSCQVHEVNKGSAHTQRKEVTSYQGDVKCDISMTSEVTTILSSIPLHF